MSPDIEFDRAKLLSEQLSDPQIKELSDLVDVEDCKTENVYFYKHNGILMRHWKPPEATNDEDYRAVHQIVLPASLRPAVLQLAHDCPMAGHLGVNKTVPAEATLFLA